MGNTGTIKLLDYLIGKGQIIKVQDANNRGKLYEIKTAVTSDNKKRLNLELSSIREEKHIELNSELVHKVLVDDINSSIEVTLKDDSKIGGMTTLIFS